MPAIVSVGYYFDKRRSFAIGIAVCGTGVGTFLLSPINSKLTSIYGWQGAFLIKSAIILNCCLCGVLIRPVPIEPAEILKNERERKAAEAKQSETEAEKKLFLAVEAVPASLYVSEPNKLNKSPTTAAVDMNKSLQVIGNINGSRDMHKRSNNSIRNMNLSQNMLAQCRSLQHIPTGSENTSQTDENSNQPPKGLVEKLKKIIDLSIFFDFIFVFFGISNFFTSLGFNAPFIFITDQATSVSIPADHAAWLLSTIGISNTVGRVILGLRLGRGSSTGLSGMVSKGTVTSEPISGTFSTTGSRTSIEDTRLDVSWSSQTTSSFRKRMKMLSSLTSTSATKTGHTTKNHA